MRLTELENLGTRLYAFLRGDSDEAPENLLVEDFVGHLTDGLPLHLGGDYSSRADMISRGWGRVGQHFDVQPEVETLLAVPPDLLIGRGHYVGHAVGSGRPLRAAFAHFWTVREGRFASVYQVTDSVAWTAAVSAG